MPGKKKTIENIPVQQVWLRNCDKETAQPIEGKIQGNLPNWLSGRLTRNGPGRVRYGKTTFNHLFDGNAVLHQFNIDDGKVTYISKYLKSDAHKRNSKANRIVVGEFGTAAYPDPCKTLLQRFMSKFEGPGTRTATDNCVVNVCHFGDELYAMTETSNLRRIDPKTLETIGERPTNLTKYIAVNTATAHPHVDPDGTVYNMGNCFAGKKGPTYNIIKFPPPKVVDGKQKSSIEQATIVCEIPCQWKFFPSYYHSFGITDDYFVFVEQPFCLSMKKVLINHFTNKPYLGAVEFYPDQQVKFRIVHRATGKQVNVEYGTEAFVTFHHVNAFVKDGQLVVDLVAIPDGSVITSAMLEELKNPNYFCAQETLPQLRRYILPLKVDNAPLDTNLVTLKDDKCKAFKRKNGSIEVVGKIVNEIHMDLPRINYKHNGKECNYTYGIEVNPKGLEFTGILKINIETGEAMKWTDGARNCSEPVFVASPDAVDEDDGVCLSSMIDKDDPHYVALVVLNAKTWKEEARVEFQAEGIVTGTFHGQFAANNETVHLN